VRTSRILPYLVLLQAGFTVPRTVTSRAVRSYRTFSPLPTGAGGLFSVALSMGLHPPGVTWRLVRRSPDFPLQARNLQRLPGRLLLSRTGDSTELNGVEPLLINCGSTPFRLDNLVVNMNNDNSLVIIWTRYAPASNRKGL